MSESVELARSLDAQVSWSAALLALLVSHVVGDVLLQTDWQAQHKPKGLEDPQGRRALSNHLSSYTVAFMPALAWIGRRKGLGRAVTVGGLVAGPHLVIDDGRLVRAWLREVKGAPEPAPALAIAVDQSFHIVSLAIAAIAAAW